MALYNAGCLDCDGDSSWVPGELLANAWEGAMFLGILNESAWEVKLRSMSDAWSSLSSGLSG